MELTGIGLTKHEKAESKKDQYAGFAPARVISEHKERYRIITSDGEFPAEVTGKILYNAESRTDFPAVGDWVMVQQFEDGLAVIQAVLPRRTLLKRRMAGEKSGIQILAVNVDTAVVLQSLDNNYNIKRLERYLAVIYESGANPLALLSKSDLIPEHELQERISKIKDLNGTLPVAAFSSFSDDDIGRISSFFEHGRTYCFLGSSGVGKSTLINRLAGSEIMKTGAVREEDSRGRHTTSHRQMIFLPNGSIVIDTPGMREIGMTDSEDGIEMAFPEITGIEGKCFYSHCTHTHEPKCAVKAAVEEGIISPDRYESWLKLKKEDQYYSIRYSENYTYEKRKRDKKFGKMCKEVMNIQKNRWSK